MPSLCPHCPAAPRHRQRRARWRSLDASHGRTEQRCMLWTGAAAAAAPRSHPESSHGLSCPSAKVTRTHAVYERWCCNQSCRIHAQSALQSCSWHQIFSAELQDGCSIRHGQPGPQSQKQAHPCTLSPGVSLVPLPPGAQKPVQASRLGPSASSPIEALMCASITSLARAHCSEEGQSGRNGVLHMSPRTLVSYWQEKGAAHLCPPAGRAIVALLNAGMASWD